MLIPPSLLILTTLLLHPDVNLAYFIRQDIPPLFGESGAQMQDIFWGEMPETGQISYIIRLLVSRTLPAP